MADRETGHALPTVTGFAARQAIAALRKRSVAIAPLLRRAGLSEGDLLAPEGNSSDHRISAVGQAKLLDYAAEAMDDSAFGLHLAQLTDPRDAGILFYIASGAKDPREALALFARYSRIANEAVRLKLSETQEGLIVEFNLLSLPRHSVRQNMEFALAAIVKGLRQSVGRNIRPSRVVFAHARNSNLREFDGFFGCPVEFGRIVSERGSCDLLEFANDVLALPLITADAKLIEALRPFCDEAAKQRHTATATLRAAVENEVEKLLPDGKARIQTVAKTLAVSVRTLSRKLGEEGTTYAEVVDGLRRSLALQYLREPGMSLSQIAWLLGYEGSTSFNHAFKRWTGRSPTETRNEKLLPAPL